MMVLLGLRKEESHLFPASIKTLIEKLQSQVEKPQRKNAKETDRIVFNGIIREDGFTVSRNFSYPQHFVPFISGRFIEGENETLLHLKFELFRGSKIFLSLWSTVCIIAYFYCGIVMKKWDYSAIALVILLLNYLIVLANFSLHCKQSRKILLKIFDRSTV